MSPLTYLLGALIAFFAIGGRKSFTRIHLAIGAVLLSVLSLVVFLLDGGDADFSREQMFTYSGTLILVAILHRWHRIKLSALTVGTMLALALFEFSQQQNDLLSYWLGSAVFLSTLCSTLVPERITSAVARAREPSHLVTSSLAR
jgi:hypothetical protein